MIGITIAVLTFNKSPYLQQCLASINAQVLHYHLASDVSIQYLLVDNGSEIPAIAPPNWNVLRLEKNVGNIGGQNKCFEVAGYPLVLFVSDDVELAPDCLSNLLELYRTGESIGQLMPILHEDRRENYGMKLVYPCYGVTLKHFQHGIPIVPSICYLMERELWKRMGGFDESLPSAYEDVDMGIRLQKEGVRSFVCLSARATHYPNQTLSKTKESRFHRARQQVIRKHYRGLDRWIRLITVKFLNAITVVKHLFAGKS